MCVAVGSRMIVKQTVSIDDRGFRALYGISTAVGEPMAIDSKCSGVIGATTTSIFLDSEATVPVQLDFKLVSMCTFLDRANDSLGLCLILW